MIERAHAEWIGHRQQPRTTLRAGGPGSEAACAATEGGRLGGLLKVLHLGIPPRYSDTALPVSGLIQKSVRKPATRREQTVREVGHKIQPKHH